MMASRVRMTVAIIVLFVFANVRGETVPDPCTGPTCFTMHGFQCLPSPDSCANATMDCTNRAVGDPCVVCNTQEATVAKWCYYSPSKLCNNIVSIVCGTKKTGVCSGTSCGPPWIAGGTCSTTQCNF